ncbi:MAG TPA: phasin family protein, partial [Novosphingobium sp.]|nr:phasin family protein [Novosphingobium sp.]
MASTPAPEPVDAAEKAYAAAAESLTEKPAAAGPAAVESVAAPVEAPAVDVTMPPKAKRAAKTAPARPAAAKVEAPAPKAPAKKKPAAKAKKPAPPKAPVSKPVAATPAANPATSKPAAVTVAKPITQLKEKIMATKTKEFTETVKSAFEQAQAKAKEGYAKGSELVGEAVDFTKGNVEAVVESGKILVEGTKKLGETYVAEAKGAYETVSADVKSMTAVKSPVELVKLQGEIATRNFEQAIELTKKNSEAWMKLATEAFAPIQGRFTLAVEK